MIQRNPKDVVAYHNRGDAYGLKGDIDRAISDYTKAIELNPNYAPAYNSRGSGLHAQRRLRPCRRRCDEGRRTHAEGTAAGPAQTKGSC